MQNYRGSIKNKERKTGTKGKHRKSKESYGRGGEGNNFKVAAPPQHGASTNVPMEDPYKGTSSKNKLALAPLGRGGQSPLPPPRDP